MEEAFEDCLIQAPHLSSHLEQLTQNYVQPGFQYIQGQTSFRLSRGHLVPETASYKTVFSYIQTEFLFQFVPIASCPVSEPTPVFFTPSLQVLRNIGKSPLNLLFPRLSIPFPLSLFSPQQQEGAQAVVPAVRRALSSQQGPITGLLPSVPSLFPPVSNSPSACPSYATVSSPSPA